MQNKTYTEVLNSLKDHIENEDSESNLNQQTEIIKQQQKLSKKLISFLNKNAKTS